MSNGSHGCRVPIVDELVERKGNFEHAHRRGRGRRVPVADELVELEGTFERTIYRGRCRRAPVADDVRARTFDLRTLERLLVNPLRIFPETLALQSLPPRGLARAARLFSAWCWDLGCGTKSQPQAHYE